MDDSLTCATVTQVCNPHMFLCGVHKGQQRRRALHASLQCQWRTFNAQRSRIQSRSDCSLTRLRYCISALREKPDKVVRQRSVGLYDGVSEDARDSLVVFADRIGGDAQEQRAERILYP